MLLSAHPHRDSALAAQARVIVAVILRDIRTRFFGHGLGYLLSIGWPLAHIIILLLIYRLTGRTTPYGSSLALYFATGLVPFMAFQYMARFTMMAIMVNKPLTHLPVVKVADLLIARVILEFFAACCTALLVFIIFYVLSIDTMPRNVPQAFAAMGGSLLLGAGFGSFNSIVAVAIPGWATGFILLQIVLYLTSGVAFAPDLIPAGFREVISWNPMYHAVDWMRSAYYESYTAIGLDKFYFIAWGCCSLLAGLAVERFARGRILAA